jgi:hypothetical protein
MNRKQPHRTNHWAILYFELSINILEWIHLNHSKTYALRSFNPRLSLFVRQDPNSLPRPWDIPQNTSRLRKSNWTFTFLQTLEFWGRLDSWFSGLCLPSSYPIRRTLEHRNRLRSLRDLLCPSMAYRPYNQIYQTFWPSLDSRIDSERGCTAVLDGENDQAGEISADGRLDVCISFPIRHLFKSIWGQLSVRNEGSRGSCSSMIRSVIIRLKHLSSQGSFQTTLANSALEFFNHLYSNYSPRWISSSTDLNANNHIYYSPWSLTPILSIIEYYHFSRFCMVFSILMKLDSKEEMLSSLH